MRNALNFIRLALAGYEPVAVRQFVAAIFSALALGGIGTGALPAKVEMALAVAAILVPALIGLSARAKVVPEAAVADPGKLEHDVDLHPQDDGDDDPEDDFAPGEHRA